MTLVEISVALVLFAAAMSLTVRTLGWVTAEQRATERRQCAALEAANTLERLAARPWDALTAEALDAETLSEAAKRSLPEGALRATVVETDHGLKRVRVEVRWRGRSGEPEAPIRLTAWMARRNDHS
jgi:hypothetical protein